MVRVLLSFCILERCFQLSTLKTPPTLRWTPFLDFAEGKRFSGGIISTIKTPSSRYCGMRCARHPECRSFNLCSQLYCDLNFDDIYSVPNGTDLLQDSPKCAYHGMQREDHPICFEEGQQKQMQDNNLGVCQIGLKRVDREWTQGECKTQQNSTWYIEFRERSIIIDVAHGGIKRNDILYVKKLLHVSKCYWKDCENLCQENNGKLLGHNTDSATLDKVCELSPGGSWLRICKSYEIWDTVAAQWSVAVLDPDEEDCCVFRYCNAKRFSCIPNNGRSMGDLVCDIKIL